MFNSVTKYLWGSSSDHEQDYTDKNSLEHGSGEQLETQQDEDWVVVQAADKENSEQPSHHAPHHHHHHHPPHPSHHHHHHPHSHNQQPNLQLPGGQDSLSQNSSAGAEAELLDEAATLAHSSSAPESGPSQSDCDACSDTLQSPLQDCGMTNYDMDSNYSSDTESSPGSVFSACSGRSHATYRPKGNGSEPWVMTPPPCFTGSMDGEATPIASSPLENLLIEHPSMSVYLSVPPSSLPPSHPFHCTHLTGENIQSSLLEEGEGDSTEPQNEGASDQGQAAVTVTQPRHRAAQAAPHPTFISPHQITQTTQYAQRALCKKGKKHINNRKCKMQNKVREARSNTGSVNHKNKRMQPSGCRASRFNQRM